MKLETFQIQIIRSSPVSFELLYFYDVSDSITPLGGF